MKRNSFFSKTLAAILAIAMIFAALPGSLAQRVTNPGDNFPVGDHANVNGSGDDAIVLDKYAYLTENGTYSIELSAFVTGTEITTTIIDHTETSLQPRPIDIILLLTSPVR